jgi:outer membrane protein assembly factor BamE (lipoprotein component of BamABCDE complex)
MFLNKPIFLLAAVAALAGACATVEAPMNDKRFATIEVGMTSDEVRTALGPPEKTMPFPASSRVAWDYTGTDTWGYMVDYSITFGPDQRVVSKFARRINDGGFSR